MANTYKNAASSLTGATGPGNATTLYTCPSSTTAIINDIIIANRGHSTQSVTAYLTDNSTSNDRYLISGVSVPMSSNFSPLPGSLVLEQNDSINFYLGASNVSGVDIVASVLEIT